MNKRERVIAAFHGRQTDHVPVCMWQHVPQSFWDDDDRFAAEQTRFFKSTNVDFMKLSGDKYFDWPAPMLEGINKADDLYRIEPLGENHPFIRCQIERTKKVVAALNGECVSLYLVFVPLSCMLTSHFRCRGKAHVATYVITLINTVNLIGSWLVIRGRFFLVGVGGGSPR